MHYADSVGAETIIKAISAFRKIPGLGYWQSPTLLKNMVKNGQKFADVASG
jgi:hypothetical protein